jgi:glycosyltransferase involved in cell wall biosynthesis
VKRFGSFFPFLEHGASERRIGRLVANHDFIKALLTHGSYDEYVLSTPSTANQRDFAQVIEGWGLDAAARQRIRLVGWRQLPDVLSREAIHVFHVGGWGHFMPGLHYLRSQHANRGSGAAGATNATGGRVHTWPITGVTHSLNGRDVVDHAVRLTHAQLMPYDAIACTSVDGREAMRRLLDEASTISGRRFAGRLEHLPLGIDDGLLDARGDRAVARRRLQIPPDAVALLVLGRITPAQKMDLAPLLKAFAQRILPQASRPVVLVIAGGGSDSDLKLLDSLIDAYGVRASTRVHGNFMLKLKPDLLAAADILLSPVDNTQETFGLSLLEAQAAGLPVVASRFDGYKDLVRDGEDGFLIDTYWCDADPVEDFFDLMDPNVAQLLQAQSVAVDLPQLADRVLRLIADEGLRAEMGQRGRDKVAREYRFSTIIARYESLWDDLADEAARIGPPKPSPNPYNFGTTRFFGHYATRTLSPDDRIVAATDASGRPLPIDAAYNEARALLRDDTLTQILAAATKPIAIRDLLARLDARLDAPLGAPHDEVWFTLLWLLKYDLLRIASERQP